MATVKIRSLSKGALNNRDYDYVRGHLQEYLPVLSLFFNEDGTLWGISIYTDQNRSITLFVDINELLYEVRFNGDCNY